MKTFEHGAVGLLLFVLISLPIGRAVAQGASAPSTDVKSVAVCFPLRTDEAAFSRLSSSDSGSEADEALWWSFIMETLGQPQTLSNGSPYPEAVSLARLMETSLRSDTTIDTMISIDTDTMKLLQPEQGVTSMLQSTIFQDADAVMFMIYSAQDTTIRFGTLLLTKTGKGASYFSGALSVFELVEGTREAVHAFVEKKMLEPTANASSASQASPQSSVVPLELPVIEPWEDKPTYEQAKTRFQFSIGGVVVGASASMVSLGLWQTYQEAAYRNTAFEGAMNTSAIMTGACMTVTAAFLTSAIWNAVLMLQAAQ